VRAYLGQVVLPVLRLEVLPRFPGPVEEGLRDAVQDSRTVPVAQIRGQARAEPFTVCTSCGDPPPAGR